MRALLYRATTLWSHIDLCSILLHVQGCRTSLAHGFWCPADLLPGSAKLAWLALVRLRRSGEEATPLTSSEGRVQDARSSRLACFWVLWLWQLCQWASKLRKAARLGEQCFAKLQRTPDMPFVSMCLCDKVRSRLWSCEPLRVYWSFLNKKLASRYW